MKLLYVLLLLTLSEAALFNVSCTVKVYRDSDALVLIILRVSIAVLLLSVCSKLSHSVVSTY